MHSRVKLIRALLGAQHYNELFTSSENETIAKITTDIRKDDKHHFLALSAADTSSVTFAPKPEFMLNEKRRTPTTLRRYIRRELGISDSVLKDNALDQLGKIISRKLVSDEYFKANLSIIQGKDIVDTYSRGECHSCMTGKNALKVGMYALNPDKIKMVVLNGPPGQPASRALLWICDDGTKVLDRIYPPGNDNVELLVEWAVRNKIAVRKAPDQLMEHPELRGDLKKYATVNADTVFPYLDTFCFAQLAPDTKTMVCSNDEDFGNIYIRQTDGVYTRLKSCGLCNGRVSPFNNFVHDNKSYCTACFDKSFFRCYMCSNVGENAGKIEIFGKAICKSCVETHYVKCPFCDDYLKRNTAVFVRVKGQHIGICSDCFGAKFFQCETCKNSFSKQHQHVVGNRNIQNERTETVYCPSCVASMFFGYGDNS